MCTEKCNVFSNLGQMKRTSRYVYHSSNLYSLSLYLRKHFFSTSTFPCSPCQHHHGSHCQDVSPSLPGLSFLLSFQKRWRTAAILYGLTVNLIYICCKQDCLNLNRTFQFGMWKGLSGLPQSFPIDVFYCLDLCFCFCCCFSLKKKCDFIFMTIPFPRNSLACGIPKPH